MREATTSSGIGVRVQNMDFPDQAIILARLTQSRIGRVHFTAQELDKTFFIGSLPRSTNLHLVLKRLGIKKLVTPAGAKRWAITPRGQQRSLDLMSEMDLAAFSAESLASSAALGSVIHTVVPPSLAPPELILPLKWFLEEHPFERNVFGMTRFPEAGMKDIDPMHSALDLARKVCRCMDWSFISLQTV